MPAASRVFAASILVVALAAIAQSTGPKPPTESQPISMPADRAQDSYRIYSSLIPLGETAGRGWPHTLWLIQDVTIAVVPPGKPCWRAANASPDQGSFDSSMNPHLALHPPASQSRDFSEILSDFDSRCHERVALKAGAFSLSSPVRLLNPTQQKEFQSTRLGEPKDASIATKYNGAPALYGFSEVYFNGRHTVALVSATHWCGNICGQGMWLAFALQQGKWRSLPWSSMGWIS